MKKLVVATICLLMCISSIMALAPAAAYAIAAIIFYFGYRIEDKDIVKMQEEIEARTA